MAAGLGFKTFTSGEVLTAADTNGYLMQGILVFANASARSAAITSPQEGQYSYLKDTNSTEYYDGAAWVSGVEGDISGVTAGTGITGGGTSGTVTVSFDQANYGGGQYAAGKNKVINGAMNVWQRGVTFNSAADGAYTADRFQFFKDGTATCNVTQTTFTPGAAPVAGYESQYYLTLTPASYTSGNVGIRQNIEDVRTFAGQTVSISFWAKASTSTSNTILYLQNFGSGGSASVNASAGTVTIGTSWTRHTVSVAIPSVSGKTIGTSSYLMIQFLRYASSATVDIWGVQVEAGSTATPFQTATGTLQGETSACQRYYQQFGGGMSGAWDNTTTAVLFSQYPVTMRVAPTIALLTTTPQIGVQGGSDLTGSGSAIAFSSIGLRGFRVGINGFTGATQYRGNWVSTQSTDILSASSEL